MAASEIVKMKTSGAASDENFVKLTAFALQCSYRDFVAYLNAKLYLLIWLNHF